MDPKPTVILSGDGPESSDEIDFPFSPSEEL